MDETVLVSVLQAVRLLTDQVASIGDRQRSDALNETGQIEPVQKIHDQEMPAVCLACIGAAHQIGVVQFANGLDFAEERCDRLRICEPARREQLEGDDSVEQGVAGFVNGAYAAFPEHAQQCILPHLHRSGDMVWPSWRIKKRRTRVAVMGLAVIWVGHEWAPSENVGDSHVGQAQTLLLQEIGAASRKKGIDAPDRYEKVRGARQRCWCWKGDTSVFAETVQSFQAFF
jgi:hypothetical protein